MLATQMSDKVESGEVKELALVCLKEFISNDLNGTKLVHIFIKMHSMYMYIIHMIMYMYQLLVSIDTNIYIYQSRTPLYRILVLLNLEITSYLSSPIPGAPSQNENGGYPSSQVNSTQNNGNQNNGNQNNGNQNNGNQNNGNQYNQQQVKF